MVNELENFYEWLKLRTKKGRPLQKVPLERQEPFIFINCNPPTVKDQSLNPQKGTQRMWSVGDLRQPTDMTTIIVGTLGPFNRFWYI